MLRSEHAIITFENGQAVSDRLTQKRHGHYRQYANRMLDTYRSGVGMLRQDLHRAIGRIFADEPDCPPQRIAAFCRLLDDASEYDDDSKGESSQLRLRVFGLASAYHPLVTTSEGIFDHTEIETKQRIAREIGLSWEEIDGKLYADITEFQPLLRFDGYPSAEELLARYNVAQVQVCLYRATSVRLLLTGDYKRIIRYIRLLRLLHTIRRQGTAYCVELSGPASVLHETRRYGVDMARLLPVLIACGGWYLHAQIKTPWGRPAMLRISHEDGLRSHLPPAEEFDSSVEEALAKDWGEQPRDGWTLHREAVVLAEGQTVFFPDFALRHEDGREAYLEIVGYWTSEYLEKKQETLRRFRSKRILLAICQKSLPEGKTLPADAIIYKKTIKAESVLEALAGAGASAATSARPVPEA